MQTCGKCQVTKFLTNLSTLVAFLFCMVVTLLSLGSICNNVHGESYFTSFPPINRNDSSNRAWSEMVSGSPFLSIFNSRFLWLSLYYVQQNFKGVPDDGFIARHSRVQTKNVISSSQVFQTELAVISQSE